MASAMGTQTLVATVLKVDTNLNIGGVLYDRATLRLAPDATTESGIGAAANIGGGTLDSAGGAGLLYLTLPQDESITLPVVGETFNVVFD